MEFIYLILKAVWDSSLPRSTIRQEFLCYPCSSYLGPFLGSWLIRGQILWNGKDFYISFPPSRSYDGPWDPSDRPSGTSGWPSGPSGRPLGLWCRPSDPLIGPQTSLAGPQTPLAGTQTPLAGPWIPPAGPHIPLAASQTHLTSPQTPLAGPQTPLNKWMDSWTDERIDRIALHPTGICSPLDHCPATIRNFTTSKKQGKGATDLWATSFYINFGT